MTTIDIYAPGGLVQNALIHEYGVIFSYGILARFLPPELKKRAVKDLETHTSMRDYLMKIIIMNNQQPIHNSFTYTTPLPAHDILSATQLAEMCEHKTEQVLCTLIVNLSERPDKEYFLNQLGLTTTRRSYWFTHITQQQLFDPLPGANEKVTIVPPKRPL